MPTLGIGPGVNDRAFGHVLSQGELDERLLAYALRVVRPIEFALAATPTVVGKVDRLARTQRRESQHAQDIMLVIISHDSYAGGRDNGRQPPPSPKIRIRRIHDSAFDKDSIKINKIIYNKMYFISYKL